MQVLFFKEELCEGILTHRWILLEIVRFRLKLEMNWW